MVLYSFSYIHVRISVTQLVGSVYTLYRQPCFTQPFCSFQPEDWHRKKLQRNQKVTLSPKRRQRECLLRHEKPDHTHLNANKCLSHFVTANFDFECTIGSLQIYPPRNILSLHFSKCISTYFSQSSYSVECMLNKQGRKCNAGGC